jgi:hypothetical protein
MSHDAPEAAKPPEVIAPPPLIYAGAPDIGLLAKGLFAIAFLSRTVSAGAWSIADRWRVTPGLPWQPWRSAQGGDQLEPATVLVTEGLYRFTRST